MPTVLFLTLNNLYGQEKLLKDSLVENILETKAYTAYNPPAISANIDSNFINYHLKPLIIGKKQKFTNRHTKNTISLTNEEVSYILSSFEQQLKLKWDNSQFPDNEIIEFTLINEYLAKDPKNSVVVISEPIYLKDRSIAVIFFSNLCCGRGIGGFVELAIYKNNNEVWERYVEISGGDF